MGNTPEYHLFVWRDPWRKCWILFQSHLKSFHFAYYIYFMIMLCMKLPLMYTVNA